MRVAVDSPAVTTHSAAPMRGPARPLSVSFEFFPPADSASAARLWSTIERLAPLAPGFVSVTDGAAGSARDRTAHLVAEITTRTRLAAAPHLTCVGATRHALLEFAAGYRQAGIRHLIALRGDGPGGMPFVAHPDGFASAAELVRALRGVAAFDIAVGAYPETHPEAPSSSDDLENLKRKVDAGASRAITQFFFDPDVYLRFRDACARRGIAVPIVPGILPVTRLSQLLRFAARCGATIPRKIAERFEGLDDDPGTHQLIAAAVAIDLVERLRSEGVDDFHIYTLNRADLSYAICHALGMRPRMNDLDAHALP